jgi:Ca2+-binding EF-hand superfamily protein
MQLREVFDLVDHDGSGAIDWQELRAGLRGGLHSHFPSGLKCTAFTSRHSPHQPCRAPPSLGIGFPVTKKEVKAMVMEADQDGNGCVVILCPVVV